MHRPLTTYRLLMWLLLGCSGVVRGQIVLQPSVSHYAIGRQVAVLDDPTNEFNTLADVLTDSIAARFVPSQQTIINRGFTTAAHWVRFDLTDHSTDRQPWLLEVAFGNYATIDLYLISKRTRQVVHKRGGDWLGRQGREIDAPTYLFRLPVDPSETYTIYLRLTSTHGQVIIPLHIWQQDAFMGDTQLSGLMWGLYYGFIIAIFLYHLALLLFTPRQHYLLLVTYIAAYLLYELTRGYLVGTRYLWPDNQWLLTNALSTTFALTSASFLLLYSSVLNLRQAAPRLQQLLYGLLGLTALSWLVSMLKLPGLSTNMIITLTGVVCGTFVMFLGGYSWYRNNQPARYYFAAAVSLYAGVLVHSLNRSGALPTASFWVQYALNIGSAFEFIFLTLGMADTIRTERRAQKQRDLQRAADIDAAEWRGLATERERVASEMHDGIGNSLLTLRQLVRGAKVNPSGITDLSHIEALVVSTYDEVRKVANNLLPAEFAQKGFRNALYELIEQLNRGGEPQFYLLLLPTELALPISKQYQLFLILTELISNIIKHAQATEASIRFTIEDNQLLVNVRDNGVGLHHLPTSPVTGRGWASIRQRLQHLSGTVELGPLTEPGTRLTLHVPINPTNHT